MLGAVTAFMAGGLGVSAVTSRPTYFAGDPARPLTTRRTTPPERSIRTALGRRSLWLSLFPSFSIPIDLYTCIALAVACALLAALVAALPIAYLAWLG